MKHIAMALGVLALTLAFTTVSAPPAAAQSAIPGLIYLGSANPPGHCPLGYTVYQVPQYDSRGKLITVHCYGRAPEPQKPPACLGKLCL